MIGIIFALYELLKAEDILKQNEFEFAPEKVEEASEREKGTEDDEEVPEARGQKKLLRPDHISDEDYAVMLPSQKLSLDRDLRERLESRRNARPLPASPIFAFLIILPLFFCLLIFNLAENSIEYDESYNPDYHVYPEQVVAHLQFAVVLIVVMAGLGTTMAQGLMVRRLRLNMALRPRYRGMGLVLMAIPLTITLFGLVGSFMLMGGVDPEGLDHTEAQHFITTAAVFGLTVISAGVMEGWLLMKIMRQPILEDGVIKLPDGDEEEHEKKGLFAPRNFKRESFPRFLMVMMLGEGLALLGFVLLILTINTWIDDTVVPIT